MSLLFLREFGKIEAAFRISKLGGYRKKMTESTIVTRGPQELLGIFGNQDCWLRRVRGALPVKIFERDGVIHIHGDDSQSVRKATQILERFREYAIRRIPMTESDAERILATLLYSTGSTNSTGTSNTSDPFVSHTGLPVESNHTNVPHATAPFSTIITNGSAEASGTNSDGSHQTERLESTDIQDDEPRIDVFSRRLIRAKTPGQAAYLTAIERHPVTFCTGPAGTGKTYLAVAMAVTYLKTERIRKIVLVRPAVEAGESLGFLPGDFQAKINPYLRPLMDAIREMIDYDTVQRLTQMEVIEMIPLAYMRGRTLNDAFMILDEAQNTTVSQMKMFLTRMGTGSKIVVCGDVTQNDLPRGTMCGLNDALRRLDGIRGIASVQLGRADIVRHRLVQEIVHAYDATEGDS